VFSVGYGQTYRVEFEIKDKAIDNVQNCDSSTRITIPSSQTYR
jgi:hypothetical protein